MRAGADSIHNSPDRKMAVDAIAGSAEAYIATQALIYVPFMCGHETKVGYRFCCLTPEGRPILITRTPTARALERRSLNICNMVVATDRE